MLPSESAVQQETGDNPGTTQAALDLILEDSPLPPPSEDDDDDIMETDGPAIEPVSEPKEKEANSRDVTQEKETEKTQDKDPDAIHR